MNRKWIKQTGVLLLHVGIVLVLIGGFIFTCCGQTAQLEISEGRIVDISSVIRTNNPFYVMLDSFNIALNEDGSVSQYYSYVTLIKNGIADEKAVISVNYPLKYSGLKMYQMSYGYFIKLSYTDINGEEQEVLCREGDMLKIMGDKCAIKVYRYIDGINNSKSVDSEALLSPHSQVVFSIYENDKRMRVGSAQIGKRVKFSEDDYFMFTGITPYTVLKVRSDPGLPVAGTGAVVFVLGVCLALLSVRSKYTPKA